MPKLEVARLVLLALAVALFSGCPQEAAPPPVEPAEPVAVVEEPAPGPEVNWDDHTQGLPFVIGYEKGIDQAKSEGKPAMMFVTTTWCGWCKRLAEGSFNDPEVKELLSQFVCVIVDGDVEGEAKKALQAQQGYPHLVFLASDGTRVGECLGFKPLEEFKPLVEKALADAQGG